MNFLSIASIILSVALGIMTFLFIFRIILTWFPEADLNSFPLSLIAWPTEPLLVPVRRFVPPLGGIDITPIIWVAICTLVREILLGQQGLITMILR